MAVKPLVGSTVETRGVRRGTRYYPAGEAPSEEVEGDLSETTEPSDEGQESSS
jgi:hypothetical protein